MTWNRLQSASTTASGVTSLTITYGSNLSSGSVLLAYPNAWHSTVSGVSDASSNAFTKVTSVQDGGAVTELGLWELSTPSGDVGTAPGITATMGASGYMALLVQEVSGIQTAADGTAGTASSAGPAGAVSPSYSSTAAGEYLVSAYADNQPSASAPTLNNATGWTQDANNVGASGNVTVNAAYKNSTNGAEADGWTGTAAGTVNETALMVAFKLAAAIVSGAVSASGTGTASVAAAQLPGVAGSGSGAASAAVVQQPGAAASGTGIAAIAAVQGPGITGTGTGAASLAVTQQPGAAGSGSGIASAAVRQGPSVSAAGTGAAAVAAILGPAAAASGAGLAAVGAAQLAALAASGTGTATAGATVTSFTYVSDTDTCTAVESGFTFISDSDTCTGSDGAELLRVADSDRCGSSEQSLSYWPVDNDSVKASESGYWSGPLGDADSCHAADGGERITLASAEACTSADDSAPVGVWTYIPGFATGPGGGFEVVHGGRVVLRGRHGGLAALKFAQELAKADRVRWVADADACAASEQEERPLSVTVTVVPALELTIGVQPETMYNIVSR